MAHRFQSSAGSDVVSGHGPGKRTVFATCFGTIAHWIGQRPDGRAVPRPQPWPRERPKEAKAA